MLIFTRIGGCLLLATAILVGLLEVPRVSAQSATADWEKAAGGKHTDSHGGHYVGGSSGSSHRGGHYQNSKTHDEYGKHKP